MRSSILAMIALLWCASIAVAEDAPTLSDLRNKIGRICPADMKRATLIDANARCNPKGSNTHSCDAKFKASTKDWLACYEQVSICRRSVDESNQTIYDYNDWVAKCAANDPRSKEAPKPFKAGAAKDAGKEGKGDGDDFADRLKKGKARNEQMEATNGKQQETFMQSLEKRRTDLIAARQEEARLRKELLAEQAAMRRAQLIREYEEQQEQRAIAEQLLGSFLQGFISAYQSSLPAPGQSGSYRSSGSTGGSSSSGRAGSSSGGGCRGYVRGVCETSR